MRIAVLRSAVLTCVVQVAVHLPSLAVAQSAATTSSATEQPNPAPATSPAAVFRAFQSGWNEELWRGRFRNRPGYLRTDDDTGWRLRLRTMQQLVAQGEASVPVLLRALRSKSAPDRILAAQTLGFLAPWVPVEPLLEAARSDDDPAVRLYAVDSLGMIGCDGSQVDWNALRKQERNGDVSKHIGYAIERKGQRLAPAVVRKLAQWDVTRISSARPGRPAPDFTLTAATGQTVRLSDYRGRKVVLVFIYGDT